MLLRGLLRNTQSFASMFPAFVAPSGTAKTKIHIIHSTEADKFVAEEDQKEFKDSNRVEVTQNDTKVSIINEKAVDKLQIKKSTLLEFSPAIQKQANFIGIASTLLANSYVFSRKEKQPDPVSLELTDFPDKDYVVELAQANIRSRQWANLRGDEGCPQFFLLRAQEIAARHNLKITVIRGRELLQERFNLMHAVGRASQHEPIFINLAYNGNPESQEWSSFVGKGVCFDSGGLNLKPTASIKDMHMDKHGATSVLSAIESVARMGLKVNLTSSIGLVQNFVSSNSYRPLDIIKSRKGITVEIGNTDAEGRLVLADCMNWTQEKYKVKNMIELSTLTGAIVVALGKKHAGLFSNSDQLAGRFGEAARQVKQETWRMPVDSYHHELIKSKHADITNSPGKAEASSSQAAAFLEKFVEPGVSWIHLDIAGTAMAEEATGYGSRALINYLKQQA